MIRYVGRDFSPEEMSLIRMLSLKPKQSRRTLSKEICQLLKWYKLDGGLKDVSCRKALLQMEKDGEIQLPPLPPRKPQNREIIITSTTDPAKSILSPVKELKNLHLKLVDKTTSRLWNELIHRYHYLGYKTLPGAQLRYFAYCDRGMVGLFGFSAAAWKTAPRDDWIGWEAQIREKNLHLVVNNSRFLILPWVQSKHLASKLLGLVVRQLADDWHDRYKYRPVLLETFVEKERFQGTCYRAANWMCLGDTLGRGRNDRYNAYTLPVKSIWIYPLVKDYCEILAK